MNEILFLISGLIVAIAITTAIEYYRNLVKARGEYDKSKDAFSDLILSFSRELKRISEKIERIYYNVEIAGLKAGDSLKKAEVFEKELRDLNAKIISVTEDCKNLHAKLVDVDKRTGDIVASHETLVARISHLENIKTAQNLPSVIETGLDAAIPIRRDKALAPLTETELTVLETLAREGPKTAPEIKDKIKLSREHTARLMKKLYEEGYLDRDSNKIPFKYSVKKEMERLLKKTETNAV
ncbi:MAG: MarR family transcriptional regulator [Candidatus Bathyarchaeia archaeon]